MILGAETAAYKKEKMTYNEFLDWADEDTLAEWVDGEIIMTSPASRKHQRIAKFLARLLDAYVSLCGLGELLFAPFQVTQMMDGGSEAQAIQAFLDRV